MIRAAWINPRAYMYSRARLVEFFQHARLNTAFILEPRWHNATDEGFGEAVRALQGVGVECHGWIWCLEFIRGGGGFDADRRARFASEIAALVDRHNLDGAHLDGIRYNKYDVATSSGEYAHMPRIDEDRTAAVTATVEDIRDALTCTLSAAVQKASYRGQFSGGPYPRDGSPIFWPAGTPFFRQTQQDPLDWLERGLVDFIAPMNYESVFANWQIETNYWMDNADTERVAMGVGWAGDSWGSYPIAPAYVMQRIEELDDFAGFAIFEALQGGFDDANERELELALGRVDLNEIATRLKTISQQLQAQSLQISEIAQSLKSFA